MTISNNLCITCVSRGTHVVIRKLDIRLRLHNSINIPIHNPQRIEMEIMRMLILNRPIQNLLILLLKEPQEARPIVPAVALRPQTDPVILGLVVRELGEPGLGKVPQSMGCLGRAVRCMRGLLTAERADVMCKISLRNTGREVSWGDCQVPQVLVVVDGDVSGLVVREANLVGLVDVEYIDEVVPAPGVELCRLGVIANGAWAVL